MYVTIVTSKERSLKQISSVITPSRFVLSPLPRSNIGMGTATVIPTNGVPSCYSCDS